ncbi:MAG: hypothetical protein ACREXR_11020 [Gammaproteobacteria bacterium]
MLDAVVACLGGVWTKPAFAPGRPGPGRQFPGLATLGEGAIDTSSEPQLVIKRHPALFIAQPSLGFPPSDLPHGLLV